jgi:hypothetical protein
VARSRYQRNRLGSELRFLEVGYLDASAAMRLVEKRLEQN